MPLLGARLRLIPLAGGDDFAVSGLEVEAKLSSFVLESSNLAAIVASCVWAMECHGEMRDAPFEVYHPPALIQLLQGELVDVDVADPEHLGAAGHVLHIALVHLFGLNLDGLALMCRQGLCP